MQKEQRDLQYAHIAQYYNGTLTILKKKKRSKVGAAIPIVKYLLKR